MSYLLWTQLASVITNDGSTSVDKKWPCTVNMIFYSEEMFQDVLLKIIISFYMTFHI